MPDDPRRDFISYLRQKAGRLREMAHRYPPRLSEKLLTLAEEFDDYAGQLEEGGGDPLH
jgi:hypothetical protein